MTTFQVLCDRIRKSLADAIADTDVISASAFIERFFRSDVPMQLLQESGEVAVSQMQEARAHYMRLLAEHQFRPGCKILEIGTWMGHGSTTLWLRQMPSDAHLVCVDRWARYVSEKDLAA